MKKKRRMTRQATLLPNPPPMTPKRQPQPLAALKPELMPVPRVAEVAGVDEEEEDLEAEAGVDKEATVIEEAEEVLKEARAENVEDLKEMIDRERLDLPRISRKIVISRLFLEDQILKEEEVAEEIELEEEVPIEEEIEVAMAVAEEAEEVEVAREEHSAVINL